MSNFRGSRYSLQHTNPDPDYNQTAEYWAFSYAEMGLLDLPAFMDKIYEENGGEKMYMISTTTGTAITHYALSGEEEEAYFVNRLHKIIQWSPCPGVLDLLAFSGGVPVPVELFISFLENGIYRIGGPGFMETILPAICAAYPPLICAVATA